MLDRRSFLRLSQGPLSRFSTPPVADAAAAGSLRPYVPSETTPWGPALARHLLRRTGIGSREEDVKALLAMTPSEAVDRIVLTAASRGPLPEPDWIGELKPRANAPASERRAFERLNDGWMADVYRETLTRLSGNQESGRFRRLGEAFLERMTVFWANHFVADLNTHNIATWLFHYRQTLRIGALRNFRDAVHDVGLTASMLIYLNGDQNRVGAPNENYARELLELFTMGPVGPDGEANYTQDDIVELSRVLTGWRTFKHEHPTVQFWPIRHDNGDKTIFGRTEAFGYDDVVPLLFEQREPQIAHFIARKLCREFVRDAPDDTFVNAVAQRLRQESFEIKPVVQAILKSEHFFAPEHVGSLIRSPVELLLGSSYQLGWDSFEGNVSPFRNKTRRMGQDLFNPPDVRGWEEGRAWINTGTLGDRVKYGRERVRYAPDAFIPDTMARPVAQDPRALVAALCQEHVAWTFSDEEIDDLTNDYLRDGVSDTDHYWDPTTEDAARRVTRLLNHLISLPAYQLR